MRFFEAFNYELIILSAVGALHGQILLMLELVLLCWYFLFSLYYLFLLFPALDAPELLSFDFLVYELLFVLLAFISSARIQAL